MPWVHLVNVASICERIAEFYPTKEQRAKGFTKVINPQEWPAMLQQLCLCDSSAKARVIAAPSQDFVPEDPLAGSDPESVAGILAHRLSAQHILQQPFALR